MQHLLPKKIFSFSFLLTANFYVSVLVLVVGSLLSVTDGFSIFEFNEDLYGALDNNLRMMMVYLAVTEIVLIIYCLFSESFRMMVLVGFFLILMIGSIEFYGEINTIAIDSNFPIFFLYTGLSHLAFGIMVLWTEKNSADEKTDNISKY